MPVDTSIYSRFQTPNPLMAVASGLQTGSAIAGAVDQANARQRQNKLREALGAGVDPGQALLKAGDLSGYQAWQKGDADIGKTQAETEAKKAATTKDQLETHRLRLGLSSQLLGSVTDANSYARALETAKGYGLDITGAPDVYDPAWVAQMSQASLTALERLNQQNKDRELKGNDASREEVARHNRAIESATNRGQDLAHQDRQAALDGANQRAQTAAAAKPKPGEKVLTPTQAGVAQQKLQSLTAIRRQLQAVRDAGAAGGDRASGPIGGRVPFTESGQRYEAAIAGLAPLIRQLTRVPGEGAMSDYETRLASAALPVRTNYASVNEQQLANIEALLNDTEAGYKTLLKGRLVEDAPSSPATGAASTPDDLSHLWGE